jgi:ATP-dependent helicase/nuclease subunit B
VLCTVIDYKSGKNKLDRLLVEHGIQLQLLTYLNVMCRSAHAAAAIGASRISPVGAFYVTLLGGVSSAKTRTEALNDVEEARKLAYRHTGRFDRTHLRKLDSREADDGDQFAYRLTKKGEFYQRGSDPLTHEEFTALLNDSEEQLFRMAREIFSGNVQPNPFRKGALTACSRCAYQAVCRIDTWTHNFRVLAPRETLGRRPGVALIPGEGPATREGI